MADVTIYDSSGGVRYPETAEDRSEAAIERLRNRLFQSIHVEYDPAESAVYTFFKASTGTPEQFVGKYVDPSSEMPLTDAYAAITDVVENELGWQLSDTRSSEAHRLFLDLPEVAPIAPERYDLSVLERLLETEPVDFATPDRESAVGLMKGFIDASDGTHGVAIAANGRTDLTADVDLVITPSASEREIQAIDGTHDRFVRNYTESKADQVVDRMRDARDALERTGVGDFSTRMVNSFGRTPIDVGSYGYVARTTDELEARKRSDVTIAGAVAGVLALLVSVWYAGALGTVASWLDATVRPTSFEFSYVDVPSIEPMSGVALLAVGAALAFGWLLIGSFVVAKLVSIPDVSGDGGSGSNRLPEEHERAIAEVVHDTVGGPFAGPEELIAELKSRFDGATSAGFVLREREIDRRKRLFLVVSAAAIAAAVTGFTGWTLATFVLTTLLDHWIVLVNVLLIVSVVSALAAIVIAVRKPITNIVENGPFLPLAVVACLGGVLMVVYGLWTTFGRIWALGGGAALLALVVAGTVALRRIGGPGSRTSSRSGSYGTEAPRGDGREHDDAGSSDRSARSQPANTSDAARSDDPASPSDRPDDSVPPSDRPDDPAPPSDRHGTGAGRSGTDSDRPEPSDDRSVSSRRTSESRAIDSATERSGIDSSPSPRRSADGRTGSAAPDSRDDPGTQAGERRDGSDPRVGDSSEEMSRQVGPEDDVSVRRTEGSSPMGSKYDSRRGRGSDGRYNAKRLLLFVALLVLFALLAATSWWLGIVSI